MAAAWLRPPGLAREVSVFMAGDAHGPVGHDAEMPVAMKPNTTPVCLGNQTNKAAGLGETTAQPCSTRLVLKYGSGNGPQEMVSWMIKP